MKNVPQFKVVCINNYITAYALSTITINKTYLATHLWENYYTTTNDDDISYNYPTSCFMKLTEYRKRKLKKINHENNLH